MCVLLVVLSLVLSLGACAKKAAVVPDASSHEPLIAEEKAVVELQLSPEELEQYTDRDAEIWKKACSAGLVSAFNKMINRDLVMIPSDGLVPLGASGGKYAQHGMLTRVVDEETGDTIQKFSVATRFMADMDLSGRIVVLEEGRYIAGMHDVVYAILHLALPPQMPAYAVIAEPVSELSPHVLRVIGLAEVKHVTQHIAMASKVRGKTSGMICTLDIMASNREIEPNDLVFLMDVDVMALDVASPLPAEADPETVMVRPRHVDKVQEPKEHK